MLYSVVRVQEWRADPVVLVPVPTCSCTCTLKQVLNLVPVPRQFGTTEKNRSRVRISGYADTIDLLNLRLFYFKNKKIVLEYRFQSWCDFAVVHDFW